MLYQRIYIIFITYINKKAINYLLYSNLALLPYIFVVRSIYTSNN